MSVSDSAFDFVDVLDIVPLHPRTLLIAPFMASGQSPGGLSVVYNERLYPVTGRVLRTRGCLYPVAAGDVVRFKPFVYEDIDLKDGRSFKIMHEQAIECVLEGYDDFTPESHTSTVKESP